MLSGQTRLIVARQSQLAGMTYSTGASLEFDKKVAIVTGKFTRSTLFYDFTPNLCK